MKTCSSSYLSCIYVNQYTVALQKAYVYYKCMYIIFIYTLYVYVYESDLESFRPKREDGNTRQ